MSSAAGPAPRTRLKKWLRPASTSIVTDLPAVIRKVQENVEACRYNVALQTIWLEILNPANKHVEDTKPWSLYKTDPEAAKRVLYDLAEVLRVVSILLKPFLPKSAETIYKSFNFPTPWERVRYEDAAAWPERKDDLSAAESLREGTMAPLFPRIE